MESCIMLQVQVPTVPTAIQIGVMGPVEEEKELKALLAETVASVESKTNWLTMNERVASMTDGFVRISIWVIGRLLW
jgi:hypothetical protein